MAIKLAALLASLASLGFLLRGLLFFVRYNKTRDHHVLKITVFSITVLAAVMAIFLIYTDICFALTQEGGSTNMATRIASKILFLVFCFFLSRFLDRYLRAPIKAAARKQKKEL